MRGLLRKVTWSYPTALITLMLFIAYQVYRLVSQPFLALGVFTAIDAVVIYLIWMSGRVPAEQSKNRPIGLDRSGAIY